MAAQEKKQDFGVCDEGHQKILYMWHPLTGYNCPICGEKETKASGRVPKKKPIFRQLSDMWENL